MDYKEKVIALLNSQELSKEQKEKLENIFPELKESEDERIKKQIRELLLDSPSNDLCRIGIDVEKTLAWLEKQDTNKEYVFRPVAGTMIENAAEQALKQGNVVLAFNGFYTPVKGKTSDDILTEYDRWLEKQGEKKIDNSNTMFNACINALRNVGHSHLADWLEKQSKETSWKPSKEEMDVLYGLAYITSKYDEHKEEVITRLYQDLKREFFNGSSYENMFPNTEDDVRRRSTIQVLEYARSLDTYNQYGKADIDKNIDWLEKQAEKKPNSQMEKCGKCQFNFTGYCDGTCILENNDQKPVDKIEPKFKPGDWISNGRYVKKIVGINSDYPYYMFQDGSSYHIKDIDTKWYIMPNMDELEWIDMETNENHCYSCELFDRKNEMCKCSTLCKNYRNTYKGFYTK